MPFSLPNTGGGLADITRSAGRYGALRDRHIRNVENLRPEQRQLGGSASLGAAIVGAPGGTNANAAFENAMRTAKARTAIQNKGDNAIRNQQLIDRMAEVKAGNQRTAMGMRARSAADHLNFDTNARLRYYDDQIKAERAGLRGGLAGMLLGGGKYLFDEYGSPAPPGQNDLNYHTGGSSLLKYPGVR